jgi:hypothetical protein
MEISYLLALMVIGVAFVVFAFLAFRTSRRGMIKDAGASSSGVRPHALCHECLGSSNLDTRGMSECASACSLMPD